MKKALLSLALLSLATLAIGCGSNTYDGSEKFYDSGMNSRYNDPDHVPVYMPDGEHDEKGNLR